MHTAEVRYSAHAQQVWGSVMWRTSVRKRLCPTTAHVMYKRSSMHCSQIFIPLYAVDEARHAGYSLQITFL